ncbi:MAG: sulfate adenylyltransferase subunit CysD [Candidatus Woesearchaeota archaeon]
MDYLEYLENKTIYIIREAYSEFRNIALLWSIGKDSTSLLWMARKAFFGKIPFPIIHIDTTYKIPEIYKFRDEYAEKWNLNLIVSKNEEAIKNGIGPEKGRFECCTALKTEALKQTIEKYKFRAILLGIRRDEHGIRAKERYFSPRDENFNWDYKHQPAELWDQYNTLYDNENHIRVHPLLHWTELDIWRYIQRENIPIVPLYFAKDGKRYRSIGCAPCCLPVESNASNVEEIVKELEITKIAERSGRSQDKEKSYMMQKLRSLGYM